MLNIIILGADWLSFTLLFIFLCCVCVILLSVIVLRIVFLLY